MSERDLEALERRLRTLPPLLDVPPSLVDRSTAAAAEDRPVPSTRRRSDWPRLPRRWTIAGGALAACAVVALVAVVAMAPSGHTTYQRIATLTGAGDASGYVGVGASHGATEPVIVSVRHLHPAPAGSYYEISFQTGSKPVPGAVFNVDSSGSAVVHLNAPAHTTWVRCWVRRRSVSDTSTGTVVLSATADRAA